MRNHVCNEVPKEARHKSNSKEEAIKAYLLAWTLAKSSMFIRDVVQRADRIIAEIIYTTCNRFFRWWFRNRLSEKKTFHKLLFSIVNESRNLLMFSNTLMSQRKWAQRNGRKFTPVSGHTSWCFCFSFNLHLIDEKRKRWREHCQLIIIITNSLNFYSVEMCEMYACWPRKCVASFDQLRAFLALISRLLSVCGTSRW